MCTKILTWVFFLLSIFSSAVSDPRTTQASLYCGSRKPGQNPSFIPTFVKEMEGLSQQVSTHHWGTQFVNSTTPMYGLAQCFNDLSHTDCLLCYAASRTKIPRCLPSLAATIFLDGCFLRYDSYRFYRQSTDPSRDTVVCGQSKQDKIEKEEFGRNVGFAIGNATAAAAGNGGFGVAEVKGSVFALAQCWKTVGSAGCKSCLEKGSKAAMGCAPSKEGRALNAGCYLRYSTEKFYNDAGGAEQVADHGHGLSVSRGIIIAVILAAAAFLLLSLSAAYACYAKLARIKQERSNVGLAATSINKYSSLKFKSNDLAKVVDPCLGEDFPAGDASNVLRIGLLCTQASVALRPSMAEVVEMLTDREIMAAVPSPKQPPFLNSTTIEPVSTRFGSYSATSSMSNALTKPEASYTSTESSGTRSSDGNSRTQELSQKQ
ncbi:unnamed protein product [Malus baccata var. baccata]